MWTKTALAIELNLEEVRASATAGDALEATVSRLISNRPDSEARSEHQNVAFERKYT